MALSSTYTARRRWARAGFIYAALLFFAILFIGPLLFAAAMSLKMDPLEYPPSLAIPQLNPANWIAAGRLGKAGSGNPFFGSFAPGAKVPFEFQVFEAAGAPASAPEVSVSRRRPGAGLGAVMKIDYAADYAELVGPEETGREPVEGGSLVTYRFEILYPGTGPRIDRLPVDINLGEGRSFAAAPLAPGRLERRGRVVSYDTLVPGSLGYIFRNYARVLKEARSVSTGKSLFLSWTKNSGIYALARVCTNLVFAAMAGYALARYRFRGRQAIFILLLFSQMVPAQVTFISNYLVIRDGIFGLSKLFGKTSLLNTMAGVIIGGSGAQAMIEASKVFIMKQFFESLPRDVEEAAVIDGANHLQRYLHVMLPMARPALGAVAILTFQGAWNDFFWPFVVLTSPEDIKTLPIGLLSFRHTYGATGDWGLMLAGSVLSAVPIIVIFIVFQRYFLQGVSFGGSKE